MSSPLPGSRKPSVVFLVALIAAGAVLVTGAVLVAAKQLPPGEANSERQAAAASKSGSSSSESLTAKSGSSGSGSDSCASGSSGSGGKSSASTVEPREPVTVIFVVDRSFSVLGPQQHQEKPDGPWVETDRRWEHIHKFIKAFIENNRRLPEHKGDQAGVICFGRQPRLIQSPTDAPNLGLRAPDFDDALDREATDIGAALDLARACFPEGTGKRIVLFSDGNLNLGDAVEQARSARRDGIQIDVVRLGKSKRKTNEVLIESIDAEPETETADV